MVQTHIQFSAGNLTDQIESELAAWQTENKIQRLWAHDATLWTDTDENKWMGWLNVESENCCVPLIEKLADDIKTRGITDIVLLGMGGSSLCPAMMAKTFGKISDYPQLHILDSTDPLQIKHLEEKINLKKTFFIVSSKSGSTLEPNIFKDYFYMRLQCILNKSEVGDQFIAITDPGSTLEAMAKKEHFKAIFYGIPSIGGRYSALSNFGIVPSALMGVDVKTFLYHADFMRQACLPNILVKDNPGVVLGVILAVCANHGKNKVTLIASTQINALEDWLEQLLAESTGKNEKGFIPISQEPLGKPAAYSDDRVFVYIRLTTAPDAIQDMAINKLEQAGFVVVRLNLLDKMHLGAELFLWEIATSIASSIIGINPFNQPDVEESKLLTRQLTDQYEKTGQLSQPIPFYSENGLSLFTDEKNDAEITKVLIGEPSIVGYLKAHFDRVKKDDYVNLSAFIEMSPVNRVLLQKSRTLIRDHKKVATCLGFGPRFLHSTGQAYKGGSNTGVFLQITADYSHDQDISVPNHHYSFGFVISAQAQGDFTVLTKRSRRVLRIHLEKESERSLQQLHDLIQQALEK
ncbi:MAG: transaldolase [Gammaproteobacteria bacterium CG_4_10_14_0_8_um_filter_38_16]|nr:MAG: transaldolase [Gammaproteobacteria bacterium CG_4_10_14_0_8_um_filter_38_16]PJA02824.1 MAG: transaldolase [Gammaproteobacteria bacterium CG_4_10_14_0_2_um_filter_38_22]PJB09682.1 MAG: transaldolase [Gammaproteobacteria bacterium CG_4_9_14_3_um_filter_38_9]PJC39128.1 MAG: transaldolase [Candidatus Peregrinibacteria bacterium CG_4_9_14_0_2_um_filter_38_9]